MNMCKTVLIYLKRNDEYLFLYRNKKNNDINKGKYIGVGGKVEKGETIEQALIREVKEETNLDLLSYEYNGIIYFTYNGYKEEMYLFTSEDFKGEIKECDEGELIFVPIKDIYKLNLWEGDKIFFEYLLNGESFFKLTLNYEDDKLISWEKENG